MQFKEWGDRLGLYPPTPPLEALKALLANEEQLPWDSPCEREVVQLNSTDTVTAIEGMRISRSRDIGMASGMSLESMGLGVNSYNTQPTDSLTPNVREYGITGGNVPTGDHVRLDAEVVAQSHAEISAVHARMEARLNAEMGRAFPTNPSHGSASPSVGLMRELRALYPDMGESFNNRLREGNRVWLRPRVLEVLNNFAESNPNHPKLRTINDIRVSSISLNGLIVSHCSGGQGMALVSGRLGMCLSLPQSVLTTAS